MSQRKDDGIGEADAMNVEAVRTEPQANVTEANSTLPGTDVDAAVPSALGVCGVCPVKPEYIRPAPPRVSLDASGKTRGMNKGSERLLSEAVEGTQRPTFEGESNFFFGAALQAVKTAVRKANQRDTKKNVPLRMSGKEEDGRGAGAAAVSAGEESQKQGEGQATVTGSQGTKRLREDGVIHCDVSCVNDCSETGEGEEVPKDSPMVSASATSSGSAGPADNGVHMATKACERTVNFPSDESAQERIARGRGLFKDKLILAPLTTVGNLPFRRICKQFGADVTVGEMAMTYNLNRLQKSEWSLLRRHECEDTFGIQIAVSGPRDAALFADAIRSSAFSYDYVEINCGCPVDVICSRGCGCGLWEKKGRLREVVQHLATGQNQPVVVKCRIGVDEQAPTLHRQIHEYSGWGASAVTIHGRSKRQRYTKSANWSYINECAGQTTLPVIGNGDIFSYQDLIQHREQFPAIAGHMIGRGALIKPWIFREIKEGTTLDLSSHERFEMLKDYTKYGLAHWGADEKGVLMTRRFLCEWLSFLCRYVPVGLLERLPQRINERPPYYEGRDELETLMASDSVVDWIRISELLLGPAGEKFRFTPKHKSNSFSASASGTATTEGMDSILEAEG